jgi:nitroreductase
MDEQHDQRPSPILHPLLASRSSPAAFDGSHEVSAAEVEALLEAARWAPSAGNSQPWAFIVGQRGDETYSRIHTHLAASAARWAGDASLLVVNLAHRYVEDTDWEYSEFSLYDLGQAVAHMTIQAEMLQLGARQFRAFDKDAVARDFAVPDHWDVATMTAYGRAAPARAAPAGIEASQPRARERRPVSELLWPVE